MNSDSLNLTYSWNEVYSPMVTFVCFSPFLSVRLCWIFHDTQKDVELDQLHKMSGISSVTRIESTLQVQGLTEQRMQGFGKLQEETSALGIPTRRLEWEKPLCSTKAELLTDKKLIGSCMSTASKMAMILKEIPMYVL